MKEFEKLAEACGLWARKEACYMNPTDPFKDYELDFWASKSFEQCKPTFRGGKRFRVFAWFEKWPLRLFMKKKAVVRGKDLAGLGEKEV